ncbi:hypothetical protein [Flavobacterium sp.]|uniref:hypothetical protein n=1 Tax=Flavobacterium sp. TaxID=239 RepID=UPI0026362EF8|nr:hypothetical protein [Flavobacterium sp.]
MKALRLAILLLVTTFAFQMNAQSASTKWSQLHEYHELLSKTFHPAENGNLNAIKNAHDYLVQRSEALDINTMPSELKSETLVAQVGILKKMTKKLSELITNKAPDVEIMRTFQNVHDVFHKIEKECAHPTK